ncbi:MAG: YihY/virulence factor BrkB family protein [Verrucomicrobiota bacterium]|nr:YihY/virulence factor BrkB family protein [Verrucomicrobiota bacterium]
MPRTPIVDFKKIQEFLDENDLARQDQKKVAPLRRFAHFWYLVGKSFIKNRGPVRASSLAYTTLLALIPMLAVALSISTGILKKDADKHINQLIETGINTFAPALGLTTQSDAEEASIERARVAREIISYVENIHSGKLGATAALALLFVGISMLSTIEATFNDMWGVNQGRSWFARIVQYWAVITLGFPFMIAAVGLTSSGQIKETRDWLAKVDMVGPFMFNFMIPFTMLSLVCTVFYKLMPHTRVHWRAAFTGGVLAGFLLQLNTLSSTLYASKVVTYSKIYGSLGVVPLFLVSLYFAWLILLFGAQVAYAFQNRLAYLQERQTEAINQRGREFVATRVMALIAQRFLRGEQPPSRLELAALLGVPSQLLHQLIACMTKAKLIVEVAADETRFSPARPVERITLESLLTALRAGNGEELATTDDMSRAVIREEYERVLLAEMEAGARVNFRTLAERLDELSKPATPLQSRIPTSSAAGPVP